MDNMKEFYKNAPLFFDEGLVREVFIDDDFCICNISNYVYAFFPFPKTFFEKRDFKKNGYCGMVIPKSMASLLIEDISNIKLLAACDSKEINDLSFRLNDKSYLILKKYKMQTDLNGPTKEIDFEMEKEIMSKSKSK
jgi:hypothetical protein